MNAAMTAPRRSPWSWAWTPVLVIGLTIVPNTAMILIALRHHPDSVVFNGFAANSGSDAAVAAQSRFAQSHAQWQHHATSSGGLLCTLTGASSDWRDAHIDCFRPNDQRQDFRVAWADLHAPLEIALPRGRWTLRLSAQGAQGDIACAHEITLP